MTRERGLQDGDEGGVAIPAHYAESWADGFGVRGWKLDLPGRGADVIAATPFAGERIPTSVFVHDIVDHHLCGFALSGYRDEAGALIQLAQRTGSDPVPDFVQIIDEDLMPGAFESDDWRELLPASLVATVEAAADTRSGMAQLRQQWGDGLLRALWIAGFVETGWRLGDAARSGWERHGLEYAARGATALALQRLFERVDASVLEQGWIQAEGEFRVATDAVGFRFEGDEAELFERVEMMD
ncbi:hypothetical protein [Thioalkalivibrio sp. ALMg13-2]|uniref:hypothetical protein n=1 Tax=Thioalkalivibrio sp. ALMg13-2 TaxID=1158167 RepID=UPI000367D68A|nr:hypothetical protein [Thioalkalivibrio sp. ALMg13-2]